MLELLDFTGDLLVLLDIQNKSKYPELESFEMPYTVLFSIGVLATVVSFAVKASLLFKQLCKRRKEADDDYIKMLYAFSDQQRKIVNFSSRIEDAQQQLKLICVNLMLAVLEDIPMVCITLMYVLRLFKLGVMPQTVTLISMLMSSGMVYLKVGKVLNVKGITDAKRELISRLNKASSKLDPERRAEVIQWLPADKPAALGKRDEEAALQQFKGEKYGSSEMEQKSGEKRPGLRRKDKDKEALLVSKHWLSKVRRPDRISSRCIMPSRCANKSRSIVRHRS